MKDIVQRRDKKVLEYWIKDRFFIEPWRSRSLSIEFYSDSLSRREKEGGEGREGGKEESTGLFRVTSDRNIV